uniref:Uncharacterized protein n=1 Tax=Oryza brachyantha TaxID=4533 RepID=J3M882_ORYBR
MPTPSKVRVFWWRVLHDKLYIRHIERISFLLKPVATARILMCMFCWYVYQYMT